MKIKTYSLYDTEAGRLIACTSQMNSRKACAIKGFQYATEGNTSPEKTDWIDKGRSLEGALNCMGFEIREHVEIKRSPTAQLIRRTNRSLKQALRRRIETNGYSLDKAGYFQTNQ